MPSTTSTLAPPLVSGPGRPSDGAVAPRPAQVEERRAAVAERPPAAGARPPAPSADLPPAEAAPAEAVPAEAVPVASPPAGDGPRPALATVHVVIVHHRGLEMLDECLASLLGSVEVESQIVVVLNHCLEPVPDLARESPRVHLVELAESHGFGEANNLGVAWARRHLGPADFYYFVNNDTLSLPDTLARLVAELQKNPAAAIAGPQTLIQSAPDFINSLGLNVTEDAWGWDEGIGIALCDYGPLPEVRQVMAVTGSALLMEARAFAELGGWPEVYDYYFEDIDLGIKTWKHGREVLHVPGSVIYHRVSATMTVGAERKYFFFWRNRLLLAAIHWPPDLLLAVLKRAVLAEVYRRPWKDSSLQRRALLGALRKLPGILGERWRQRRRRAAGPQAAGGSEAWRRFLHPAGSVPRITLPQPGEKPASQLAAAAAEAARLAPPRPLEAAAGELLPAEKPAGIPRPALIDAAVAERLRRFAPAGAKGRRLLVFGWSPLPFENQRMNYAPGTRSWQFAAALAAEGHVVALACAAIPGATFETPPPIAIEERQGLLILRLELAAIEDAAEGARLVAAFGPDALIGAAPGPSGWAAAAAGELPLWVDFFGDPLAEGQAREAVYPGIEAFGAYAAQVAPLLRRGDAFSAVSRRQRLALIGQLGLAGRLRGAAAGHELVRVLPCAAESPPESLARPGADGGAGDGELAAREFVVFWSGGFNTWCDVPTLIEGLEAAMDEKPELVFVATGGAIAGHDDLTARDFEKRVEASRHAGRFRRLGHVPREEAEAWQRRADLALITEKKLYERELGSSGRLSGWLAAGQAVLSTGCSELAVDLERQSLILTYDAGDAADLTRRLIEAAESPALLRELSSRAREYAQSHLSYAATTGPLRAWAAQPRRAPRTFTPPGAADAAPEVPAFLVQGEVAALERAIAEREAKVAVFENEAQSLRRESEELAARLADEEETRLRLEGDLAASRESFHRLRGELGQIHQSRMWRIWMGYLGLRQRLRRVLGLGRAD